ncbi:two-component system regulatory protein YycI [Ornithinibacillus contaminans]|uniref:two-component system regulatory protein YycI n=1 Tax=Ornithinibacillus contaminans TaxID=694055 RepID=UPI00064DCCBD|nr:two-component system regulatory protein YycI [Ornithinibacillus contaminans]
MQWSQIKTIFILCFFLLNIYLIVIVMQKQTNEDFDSPEVVQQTEHEKRQLESENIKVTEDLPEATANESLIVSKKTFTQEEIDLIKEAKNQDIEVVNNNFIISRFDDPPEIPAKATDEELTQIVLSQVYMGDQYSLDSWDKERNILTFFQKQNDKVVYYNQSGLIFAYLNENNEIVAYTQSVLGEPEVVNEERSLIKPFQAVYTLYENNVLFSKDEVTDVELGYQTMLPLNSGRQVLVPTWKITINNSGERFVNGIEGKVIPVNDDFVASVLEISISNTQTIIEQDEFKESMLALFLTKLGEENRSEEN